jgi:hypothetical protein
MIVAMSIGLAQANAVNDGGVVERVTYDGIFWGEKCFEESRVRIEAGAVKDGIVGLVERCDLGL